MNLHIARDSLFAVTAVAEFVAYEYAVCNVIEMGHRDCHASAHNDEIHLS